MDVNKFQILRQGGVSKQINIPIELTWDYRDIDLEASYDYWKEVEQEIEKL